MSGKMPNDHTENTWKTHMETLMKRMRQTEIAEKLDEELWKWYFERGMEVPDWKVKKNPDWWVQYLKDLDIEQ